ncbi:MAG TPA: 5'-nucleotidase C-terminal domain-containing protein [Oligoflexia bacterium]|nr:5'-nucleotidase C-terminal domain-containing protein [Oligoflexia bacterium]
MRVLAFALSLMFGPELLTPTTTAAAEISPTPKPQNQAMITLLHINDAYELAPIQGRGGLARIKGLSEQIRRHHEKPENVLLLHAGDFLAPSLDSQIFRGTQMIDVMNRMGFDAVTLGNHEFEYGPETLLERMATAKFPIVTSNIHQINSFGFGNAHRFLLIERNGIKIGIFAVTTPSTTQSSFPGPNVVFDDVIPAAKKAVRQLQDRGAQFVIALTHLGIAEDRALARAVDGVHLILGGHDHSPMHIEENGVQIIKAGTDAQYLGRVDLVFTDGGAVSSKQSSLIPITAETPSDPDLDALITNYVNEVQQKTHHPLAATEVDFEVDQDVVRTKETAVGNLLADAFRERFKADLAIVGGGTIRGNRLFKAGESISLSDIRSMIPWAGTLAKIKISGATLLRTLEHSINTIPSSSFPQVSKNVRLEFDPSRSPGNRIVTLTLDGIPVSADQQYTLAIDNYRINGGDGFGYLAQESEILIGDDAKVGEFDALVDAIRGKTIAPVVDGRVKCVDILKSGSES